MVTSGPTASPVLEVAHVTVRFGGLTVFHDLSFTAARGASVAVIGPNGAGKTALFRALIGAIPFEGQIRWAPGTQIGYVPQKLDLERDIPVTGEDLLRARQTLARDSGRSHEQARGLVGLSSEVLTRPIGSLSGGQFQRLLIAVALVGQPTVLLLDEPTASVDEGGQEHLNELVHRLAVECGLTVLLISHDLSVVFRYATSVVCLGGLVASVGPPSAVLSPAALRQAYGTDVAFHLHGH